MLVENRENFEEFKREAEKKSAEDGFINYAPRWDGPTIFDEDEFTIITLKEDIVKLTVWYAMTETEN